MSTLIYIRDMIIFFIQSSLPGANTVISYMEHLFYLIQLFGFFPCNWRGIDKETRLHHTNWLIIHGPLLSVHQQKASWVAIWCFCKDRSYKSVLSGQYSPLTPFRNKEKRGQTCLI